jgi:hypothetical protein
MCIILNREVCKEDQVFFGISRILKIRPIKMLVSALATAQHKSELK